MRAVDERVAQRVILIGKLQGGLVKDHPLLHPVALGEGAGGKVAHNDLQGNDGHPLDQGFPRAELPNQVGGDSDLLQTLHKQVGHLVVDDALAADGPFLQTVEGGSVVLVRDDELLRVLGFVDLFGLPFV